jgi:hypothetical protein
MISLHCEQRRFVNDVDNWQAVIARAARIAIACEPDGRNPHTLHDKGDPSACKGLCLSCLSRMRPV